MALACAKETARLLPDQNSNPTFDLHCHRGPHGGKSRRGESVADLGED